MLAHRWVMIILNSNLSFLLKKLTIKQKQLMTSMRSSDLSDQWIDLSAAMLDLEKPKLLCVPHFECAAKATRLSFSCRRLFFVINITALLKSVFQNMD